MTNEMSNSSLAKNRAGQGKRVWKKRFRRFMLYALGFIIVAALVMSLWPKPAEVETARVTAGPLTVSVLEEGKTRIRDRYTISAPVTGMLERVPLRASDRIEAGKTVVATLVPPRSGFLDPRTRAQGEAQLHSAESVVKIRAADIERVRAALELATREYQRTDELYKSQSISRQDWDVAENRVKVLQRELESALFSLQAAQFEVEQARASLLSASTGPSTTTPLQILAPVDGYVLQVFEESARNITAGTPIMEVGNPSYIEAEIELLSTDAVGVRPGAPVSIEHWGGEASLNGVVSAVERGAFTKISALGVEEQRVLVRVDFVDTIPPGHTIGDRYRVEARIVTWHGDSVLQVPTSALFRHGNGWRTFVVEGGKAVLRRVEIDHNNGSAAEVLSGLSEGETVILHPPDAISENTRVTVKGK